MGTQKNEEVKTRNRTTVGLVSQRVRQNLLKKKQLKKIKSLIRKALRGRVGDNAIEAHVKKVTDALEDPEKSFYWFNAVVEAPEVYFLGHKAALAVDIVDYLKDREDLLEEYVLHEALERIEAEVEKSPELDHFVNFVKDSQRGIAR